MSEQVVSDREKYNLEVLVVLSQVVQRLNTSNENSSLIVGKINEIVKTIKV